MTSPYSAARLNELHWIERKTVEQIAAAYNATLEFEDELEASVTDVQTWLHDAGIAIWSNPDRRRILTHSDSLRTGWPAGTTVRPCAGCKHEWPLVVFAKSADLCGNCTKIITAAKTKHAYAPASRRNLSTPDLPPKGFSRCKACKNILPDEEMHLDKNRTQYGICKPCQSKKYREYYLKHQERLQARSLADKRAKRALGGKND